jgi:glycosyltransferase involved in cell wall biosynthesis
MKVIIIYKKFIYEDKDLPVIGGIQNYIENLVDLILDMKHEVIIVQQSKFYFERELKYGFKLFGIVTNKYKDLCSFASRIGNPNDDLLIFSTSTITQKTNFKKTIAIQHGVFWDYNTISNKKPLYPIDMILKLFQSFKEIQRQKNVSKLVAVDYNYVNWYRSVTIYHNLDYVVIPNFAILNTTKHDKNDSTIRIIFARRLEKIRGTDLLIEAMPKILDKYTNVKLIIAGDGSQFKITKERFANYSSVEFIRYQPSESMNIHSMCDIAIVPTVASEGTSFSLLEAMSSGCAVICTDIGGMTNIIHNEFNGLIIKANGFSLYEAIIKIIEDENLRLRLGMNARKTIEEAFSQNQWRILWSRLINSFES